VRPHWLEPNPWIPGDSRCHRVVLGGSGFSMDIPAFRLEHNPYCDREHGSHTENLGRDNTKRSCCLVGPPVRCMVPLTRVNSLNFGIQGLSVWRGRQFAGTGFPMDTNLERISSWEINWRMASHREFRTGQQTNRAGVNLNLKGPPW